MKNIKLEFVKVFGGTYYDNKDHEIANAYYFTGKIPLYIRGKLRNIKTWFLLRYLDFQILYLTIIIKIKNEK